MIITGTPVIECVLSSSPDFDNQEDLIDSIEQGVEAFIGAVDELFISYKEQRANGFQLKM